MKNYLLLRDNVQSGPYTLSVIGEMTLRPADLLWIVDESTRWYSVSELPELGAFVVTPPPRPFVIPEQRRREPEAVPAVHSTIANDAFPDSEALVARNMPGFREAAKAQPRRFRFRPMEREGSPAWILGLFACLICGSVVVKKIIEQPEPQFITPAHMAAQPLPEEKTGAGAADINYQNAIKKETFEPDSTSMPVSSLSLQALRRLVTIGTNKYQVGIFKGSNDLQVRVRNCSELALGKINLLVEFLKTDGTSIRKERYSVYNVKPGTEKILVVPSSKQGLRVRYKLLGVEGDASAHALTTA